MEKYNYKEQIESDIKVFIDNEVDLSEYESKEDLIEYLEDVLWTCDSVTGNGSGSYFCDAYKAEEAICHNWDLVNDMFEEFGFDENHDLPLSPERLDVSIRCYLLSECIENVINKLYN